MSGVIKLKIALIAVLFSALAWPGTAVAAPPRVTAASAVLVDVESGQIYFSKNHTKRSEPASLTKIMTAVVALENGNPDDIVKVGSGAASVSVGSIIDLRKGEKITLAELIKAALVHSANDSTVAIAEHVGGSHDRFIKMMNYKASALGLFGTRFVNTNGYHDPNHYTTAYDLAVLARYALGNPRFNELVQTRETTVQWVEPPEREEKLRNSNRLLFGVYEGVDGVKTGTTPMAGNCLVASASREGRRLIAVALHSDDRYRDCINMFEYGFNVLQPVAVFHQGEAVTGAAVTGGSSPAVNLCTEKSLEIRVDPDDIPKLEKRIIIETPPAAPVRQGQKLGECACVLKGQELGRVSLVAEAGVPRRGWPMRLWDGLFVR